MEGAKPTAQVLMKHKEHQTVQEFASMLEKIAQKLREDGKFTFVQGTEAIEVIPAQQLKVDYKYTVKGDQHEFEIEFKWYTGERTLMKMTIE